MITIYKKDSDSFRFLTNYIQLICINNNKYLVLDGQHRLNMYERLVKDNIINDEQTRIIINIINETNENEIYELYKNLNYDISNQLKYSQLKELLGQHSKRFLSNSKFIYSLDEYINILYDSSYIEAFST